MDEFRRMALELASQAAGVEKPETTIVRAELYEKFLRGQDTVPLRKAS